MKIKNSGSKHCLFRFYLQSCIAVAVSNLYLLNKSKARISDPQSATYEYRIWYFNPRNDGKQPEPIKEASFFSKYNSYYVGDQMKGNISYTFDAG